MATGNLKMVSGSCHTLGATWDGSGVNFALFSEHAERVELCLFDDTGKREIARYILPECVNNIWNGYCLLYTSPSPRDS